MISSQRLEDVLLLDVPQRHLASHVAAITTAALSSTRIFTPEKYKRADLILGT